MAQFAVYPNLRDSHGFAPYLVDVQTDLLEIETRVVIPLAQADYLRDRISRLNPTFEINAQQFVLATTEIVAIETSNLKTPIADLSAHRDVIIGAIDLLFTGI